MLILKRLKNQEVQPINTDEFYIGRGTDKVNYSIADNKIISRIHAVIIARNGKHYIKDLHSTNKTFVNGNEISPDVEIEITAGMTIRFADEDFVVFDDDKTNEEKASQELKKSLSNDPKKSGEVIESLIKIYHNGDKASNSQSMFSKDNRNLLHLCDALCDAVVYVPVTLSMADKDIEHFKSLPPKENLSYEESMAIQEKMTVTPDVMKTEDGTLFLPVFTSKEQAPDEYISRFVGRSMDFISCYRQYLCRTERAWGYYRI